MPLLPDEQAISLDKLDANLRAILNIKIREFVHLSPVFNCIPSIDVSSYGSDISRSLARTKNIATGEIPQVLRQEVTQETINAMPDKLVKAITDFDFPSVSAREVETSQPVGQKTASALEEYLDGLQAASKVSAHTNKKEITGELSLQPRTYFAGYDTECPNRFKPAPPRRRYARRIFT